MLNALLVDVNPVSGPEVGLEMSCRCVLFALLISAKPISGQQPRSSPSHITIAPISEPVWRSNVRGLTLNSDWSHCVAGKWVLYKQNPFPGTGDSSSDFR